MCIRDRVQVVGDRVFPVDVQRHALAGGKDLVFRAVDHLAGVAPAAVFVPRVDAVSYTHLAYIRQELAGAKGVIGVSGLGLMLGIQTEKNAADIIAACREKGVLVIKAKDKLRLLPALNIPMDQLAKAVAVIKECCAG